jgi:two-component sensor histidine kinase
MNTSTVMNGSTWEWFARTLRELTASSSREDVISTVGRAARQLCEADSIRFRQWDASSSAASAQDVSAPEKDRTSITIAAGSGPHNALMTVFWTSPHAVSDLDRKMLGTLAQAAALALRSTGPKRELPLQTQAFQPHERARFFDFQRQVRSLLAMVRSIVRRMVHTSVSIEDYAAHLEGRLGALARVHGFLLRAPKAGVDLEELVRSELLAQSVRDDHLQVDGPRVVLGAKEAETLGLTLHELATNSIKFGALGHKGDELSVRWRLEGPQRTQVVLDWHECGARRLRVIHRKGFGFEVVELLFPYELGGTSSIVVEPRGLHCSLTFPVPPHDLH